MFKKLSESDIPKRERKSESRFEQTEEWRQMKKAIDGGLEPESAPGAKDAGAVVVQLSDDDLSRIGLVTGINGRKTVDKTVKRYLRAHGLKYRVKALQREGLHHIYVLGALAPRAARRKSI